MGRYNSKFYNKSLEIKKISKKISDYIIFELSNSTDYSKNTILFDLPNPVKYAFPWLLRRLPSITNNPLD